MIVIIFIVHLGFSDRKLSIDICIYKKVRTLNYAREKGNDGERCWWEELKKKLYRMF